MRKLLSLAILIVTFSVVAIFDVSAKGTNEEGGTILPLAIPLVPIAAWYPKGTAYGSVDADVVVDFRLTKQGAPKDIKVVSCNVAGMHFEEAAILAVSKGHFLSPAYYHKFGKKDRVQYTVKFRNYRGLCLFILPEIPLGREDGMPAIAGEQLDAFAFDWCMPRHFVLAPLGDVNSVEPAKSGVVQILFSADRMGNVTDARVAYSSVEDTSLDQMALKVVRDGVFAAFQPPWTNPQDSHLVVIEFRSTMPDDSELTPSSTQLPKMVTVDKPGYSKWAKMTRRQGTVVIRALVDSLGKVQVATLSRSCGTAELDSSAVESAYRCTYSPVRNGGKGSALWVSYKVDFDLDVNGWNERPELFEPEKLGRLR